MPKIPARYIILHRVEGFQYETERPEAVCGTDKVSVWTKANEMLRRWSWNAPKDGSYQKVDVTVVWANGATYRCQYHLTATNIEPDLKHRVWAENAFYAGMNRPPQYTEEQYDTFRKENPERVKRCIELLEHYEVSA